MYPLQVWYKCLIIILMSLLQVTDTHTALLELEAVLIYTASHEYWDITSARVL